MDKIPIASEKKVSFEGYFEMKELYTSLKSYLEDSRHYDITEQDFKEKNISGDREIVSKNSSEQLYNDYYKIFINYVLEMKGKDVEIEIAGKKKVLTQGIAKITINTYIQPDYLGKSSTSPLMEFVTRVYDKYFGKDDFSKVIASMSKDVGQLITIMKQEINSKLQ